MRRMSSFSPNTSCSTSTPGKGPSPSGVAIAADIAPPPERSMEVGRVTRGTVGRVARIEVEPATVVAGGDALARDADGRVVFVSGALPGERVIAHVVEERRDYRRADVVEILEPSPDRV